MADATSMMHHRVEVAPLVKLCSDAADATAAVSGATTMEAAPSLAEVREAAQALARLARHAHTRVDMAQCGAAVALARLCTASRDDAVLRSCVAGLAALTCYEGISQQVTENAPKAIVSLVGICSGNIKVTEQGFSPAMLRNAAGAVANLALFPAARVLLLSAEVVSALLILMRRYGVGEYIVSSTQNSAFDNESSALSIGAAPAQMRSDADDGSRVGSNGVAGNAAWALRNLSLASRSARVVARSAIPALLSMLAADDVDDGAVANASGAIAALAASDREVTAEGEQEQHGDLEAHNKAEDEIASMSVCEQLVAAGASRPLVQLAQRLELSLSLARDAATESSRLPADSSARRKQARAAQQWERAVHFAHEALECLSRDPKARLALVEAGAVQMLVRRCTASAAAARAAEEAEAVRAAEADAEPDTNTAMAMARSPSSRHQQTATDEAMLRCAASTLASLAGDQEVWPAIANTDGGGAAAVWPIVQLCSSIDDPRVLAHGAAAMATLAREANTRQQMLASGAPRALLRLCSCSRLFVDPHKTAQQIKGTDSPDQDVVDDRSIEPGADTWHGASALSSLVSQATCAIAVLALEAEGRTVLERDGALTVLVQLLRRLTTESETALKLATGYGTDDDDPKFQASATAALNCWYQARTHVATVLARLARDGNSRTRMVWGGAIEPLVALLRNCCSQLGLMSQQPHEEEQGCQPDTHALEGARAAAGAIANLSLPLKATGQQSSALTGDKESDVADREHANVIGVIVRAGTVQPLVALMKLRLSNDSSTPPGVVNKALVSEAQAAVRNAVAAIAAIALPTTVCDLHSKVDAPDAVDHSDTASSGIAGKPDCTATVDSFDVRSVLVDSGAAAALASICRCAALQVQQASPCAHVATIDDKIDVATLRFATSALSRLASAGHDEDEHADLECGDGDAMLLHRIASFRNHVDQSMPMCDVGTIAWRRASLVQRDDVSVALMELLAAVESDGCELDRRAACSAVRALARLAGAGHKYSGDDDRIVCHRELVARVRAALVQQGALHGAVSCCKKELSRSTAFWVQAPVMTGDKKQDLRANRAHSSAQTKAVRNAAALCSSARLLCRLTARIDDSVAPLTQQSADTASVTAAAVLNRCIAELRTSPVMSRILDGAVTESNANKSAQSTGQDSKVCQSLLSAVALSARTIACVADHGTRNEDSVSEDYDFHEIRHVISRTQASLKPLCKLAVEFLPTLSPDVPASSLVDMCVVALSATVDAIRSLLVLDLSMLHVLRAMYAEDSAEHGAEHGAPDLTNLSTLLSDVNHDEIMSTLARVLEVMHAPVICHSKRGNAQGEAEQALTKRSSNWAWSIVHDATHAVGSIAGIQQQVSALVRLRTDGGETFNSQLCESRRTLVRTLSAVLRTANAGFTADIEMHFLRVIDAAFSGLTTLLPEQHVDDWAEWLELVDESSTCSALESSSAVAIILQILQFAMNSATNSEMSTNLTALCLPATQLLWSLSARAAVGECMYQRSEKPECVPPQIRCRLAVANCFATDESELFSMAATLVQFISTSTECSDNVRFVQACGIAVRTLAILSCGVSDASAVLADAESTCSSAITFNDYYSQGQSKFDTVHGLDIIVGPTFVRDSAAACVVQELKHNMPALLALSHMLECETLPNEIAMLSVWGSCSLCLALVAALDDTPAQGVKSLHVDSVSSGTSSTCGSKLENELGAQGGREEHRVDHDGGEVQAALLVSTRCMQKAYENPFGTANVSCDTGDGGSTMLSPTTNMCIIAIDALARKLQQYCSLIRGLSASDELRSLRVISSCESTTRALLFWVNWAGTEFIAQDVNGSVMAQACDAMSDLMCTINEMHVGPMFAPDNDRVALIAAQQFRINCSLLACSHPMSKLTDTKSWVEMSHNDRACVFEKAFHDADAQVFSEGACSTFVESIFCCASAALAGAFGWPRATKPSCPMLSAMLQYLNTSSSCKRTGTMLWANSFVKAHFSIIVAHASVQELDQDDDHQISSISSTLISLFNSDVKPNNTSPSNKIIKACNDELRTRTSLAAAATAINLACCANGRSAIQRSEVLPQLLGVYYHSSTFLCRNAVIVAFALLLRSHSLALESATLQNDDRCIAAALGHTIGQTGAFLLLQEYDASDDAKCSACAVAAAAIGSCRLAYAIGKDMALEKTRINSFISSTVPIALLKLIAYFATVSEPASPALKVATAHSTNALAALLSPRGAQYSHHVTALTDAGVLKIMVMTLDRASSLLSLSDVCDPHLSAVRCSCARIIASTLTFNQCSTIQWAHHCAVGVDFGHSPCKDIEDVIAVDSSHTARDVATMLAAHNAAAKIAAAVAVVVARKTEDPKEALLTALFVSLLELSAHGCCCVHATKQRSDDGDDSGRIAMFHALRAAGTMISDDSTSSAIRHIALRWVVLVASGGSDSIMRASTENSSHSDTLSVMMKVVQAEARQGGHGLLRGLMSLLPKSNIPRSGDKPYFIQDGGLAVETNCSGEHENGGCGAAIDDCGSLTDSGAQPMTWLVPVFFALIAWNAARMGIDTTAAASDILAATAVDTELKSADSLLWRLVGLLDGSMKALAMNALSRSTNNNKSPTSGSARDRAVSSALGAALAIHALSRSRAKARAHKQDLNNASDNSSYDVAAELIGAGAAGATIQAMMSIRGAVIGAEFLPGMKQTRSSDHYDDVYELAFGFGPLHVATSTVYCTDLVAGCTELENQHTDVLLARSCSGVLANLTLSTAPAPQAAGSIQTKREQDIDHPVTVRSAVLYAGAVTPLVLLLGGGTHGSSEIAADGEDDRSAARRAMDQRRARAAVLSLDNIIQRNAAGALRNLARGTGSTEDYSLRSAIVHAGAIPPLIRCIQVRLWNTCVAAVGAIQNLAHSFEGARALISHGAVAALAVIQQRLWQDLGLSSGADCRKPANDLVLDDQGSLDGTSPLKVLTTVTSTLTILTQQFSAAKLKSCVDFGDYNAAIGKKCDNDLFNTTTDEGRGLKSMPAIIIQQAQENANRWGADFAEQRKRLHADGSCGALQSILRLPLALFSLDVLHVRARSSRKPDQDATDGFAAVSHDVENAAVEAIVAAASTADISSANKIAAAQRALVVNAVAALVFLASPADIPQRGAGGAHDALATHANEQLEQQISDQVARMINDGVAATISAALRRLHQRCMSSAVHDSDCVTTTEKMAARDLAANLSSALKILAACGVHPSRQNVAADSSQRRALRLTLVKQGIVSPLLSFAAASSTALADFVDERSLKNAICVVGLLAETENLRPNANTTIDTASSCKSPRSILGTNAKSSPSQTSASAEPLMKALDSVTIAAATSTKIPKNKHALMRRSRAHSSTTLERQYEVQFGEGPLGMVIRKQNDGLVVSRVQGAAEKNAIAPGDTIVGVAQTIISGGMTEADVAAIIKASPRPLVCRFARKLAQPCGSGGTSQPQSATVPSSTHEQESERSSQVRAPTQDKASIGLPDGVVALGAGELLLAVAKNGLEGQLASPELLNVTVEALSAFVTSPSGAQAVAQGGGIPVLVGLLAGNFTTMQTKTVEGPQSHTSHTGPVLNFNEHILRHAAAALSRMTRCASLRGALLQADTLRIAVRRLVQFTPFALTPPALPQQPTSALPGAEEQTLKKLQAETRAWSQLWADACELAENRVAIIANCAAIVAQVASVPVACTWLLQRPLDQPIACVTIERQSQLPRAAASSLLAFQMSLSGSTTTIVGVAPASLMHFDALLSALMALQTGAPASPMLFRSSPTTQVPELPAVVIDGALANASAALASLAESPAARAKIGAKGTFRPLVTLLEGVIAADADAAQLECAENSEPANQRAKKVELIYQGESVLDVRRRALQICLLSPRAVLLRLSVARSNSLILAALARDVGWRRPLLGAGAIQALVALLQRRRPGTGGMGVLASSESAEFCDDVTIARYSAEALSQLVREERARALMFESNGIPPLIALCMRRSANNSEAHLAATAHAASTLARLAGGASGVRLATAAKGGALFALTEAQRRLGTSAPAPLVELMADGVGALIEHRSRLTAAQRHELAVLTPDERRQLADQQRQHEKQNSADNDLVQRVPPPSVPNPSTLRDPTRATVLPQQQRAPTAMPSPYSATSCDSAIAFGDDAPL